MASTFRTLGGFQIVTPTEDISATIIASPDPREIELELMQVAGEIANIQKPLVAAAAMMANDMKRRFDTETTPDGDHWYPLDEEYLGHKVSLGYPEDILHRTGQLEEDATDPDAFIVMGDAVFFNPSKLPEYGLLQQTGTGEDFSVGIAARHRARAADDPEYKKEYGGAHSSTGVGRGKALPSRPFIGMSEEAEGEAEALFDFWFDEAISAASTPYVHPGGTVQSRIAGQFGPKVVF